MTLDDQLSVLANRHRRQLLLALAKDTPQNGRTAPTSTVETDGGDQEHVIAMHHAHLPKLEDHGFIEWSQETGIVTKGPQFDAIDPLLTTLAENHSVQPVGEPPD